MNLHAIVRSAISIVNPYVTAILYISTGFTTNADGSRTPTYTTTTLSVQVQAVTEGDLKHVSANNQGIQSVLRSVWLDGNWNGIIKADQTGGDFIEFGGYRWKVIQVMEAWTEWTHVIVSQQNLLV
jgi:hypothetical protein